MLQLYKNIRSRRKALRMTQTELAEKAGYSDKAIISMIEHGKIDLPVSKIMAIAEALRISPGELLGDDGIVEEKRHG